DRATQGCRGRGNCRGAAGSGGWRTEASGDNDKRILGADSCKGRSGEVARIEPSQIDIAGAVNSDSGTRHTRTAAAKVLCPDSGAAAVELERISVIGADFSQGRGGEVGSSKIPSQIDIPETINGNAIAICSRSAAAEIPGPDGIASVVELERQGIKVADLRQGRVGEVGSLKSTPQIGIAAAV